MIDCIVKLRLQDIEAMKQALDCYATYQATIAASNVVEQIGDTVYFEIFGEDYKPALDDLTKNL